jgi:TolB-like protein
MSLFAQTDKYTIAVSDLVGQGIDQSTASILSDRLRTELFKTGSITVLERGVMQDILKEQGFQQTSCSSDTCIVQVGQLLGVSHMISGTIGKIERLYTLDIRMFEVSSGKIIYSESVDCECPVEKVITGSIPAIAKKIARHVTNPSADTVPVAVQKESPPPPVKHYGGLRVASNPSGAQVILNGYPSGTTPFKTEKLAAGQYRLRLDMPTYKLIDDSLAIIAGHVEKREFSLEHTVTWRDSVAAARRDSLRSIASAKQAVRAERAERTERAVQAVQADKVQKPKKNPALKITFGVVSLVSAAAGVYCDFMVKEKINKTNSLKSEYALLSDNARYPEYSSKIKDNTSSAKSFKISEYICYGLAGACATGFCISLAF